MFRKFQKVISVVSIISVVFTSVILATPGNEVSHPVENVNYGTRPILFEANEGQTDAEVRFISRTKGYTLFLTDTGAVFSLKGSGRIEMSFARGYASPVIDGVDKAVTRSNYYKGKARYENVANYEKVKYTGVYDGIDAVYYGNADNELEFDLVVAPNADPGQIELRFDGAESLTVNDGGDLVIKTTDNELVQQRPFSYQDIDGERREVPSRYVVSENTVRFELGEYDTSKQLVIDPVLKYLTYVGGGALDTIGEVAADLSGNAYIVGETDSLDFPVPGSRLASDKRAIHVTKLDPVGQTILYNTFLDGSRVDGIFSSAIAIDADGEVYITGTVDSTDYPTTSNSFQPDKSFCFPATQCIFNDEIVVTKLDTDGEIVYSTYLGGAKSDVAEDIAVDSSGKAYVTGFTTSGVGFPKKNEFQTTGFFGQGDDGFLTVFNADGTDITYSTGLGGNSADQARGIALDAANNAYITGETSSNGTFPIKNFFQGENAGGKDVFVAKFNPALAGESSLIYSTFIGGGGTDSANAIAVNSSGQAHVTGVTGSFNYPLANAFRTTNQINEAFVTVVGSSGNSLVNSSFLGGADQEFGDSITVANGAIYVMGRTKSNNFPTALPIQATRAGGDDAFVTKLRFGPGILWSTFLGGSANENTTCLAVRGEFVYVGGSTASTNLATTTGVLKPATNNSDGFLGKILDTTIDSVGVFRPATTFILTQSTVNIVSQNATFTAGFSAKNGVSGDWNGDGTDTIGSFNDGAWKIRNSNFPIINLPGSILPINFGTGGDLPVVGDWNGDGIDSPGVFRPSTGQFFLTNSTLANPPIDFTINFGVNGDLPVAGDWNADGVDTVGVFRPSATQFFLTNANIANPSIDIAAFFGLAGDLPIAGDFDGNGTDTVGVRRASTSEFFLTNDNLNSFRQFVFGITGDQPLVGDWDGLPVP